MMDMKKAYQAIHTSETELIYSAFSTSAELMRSGKSTGLPGPLSVMLPLDSYSKLPRDGRQTLEPT